MTAATRFQAASLSKPVTAWVCSAAVDLALEAAGPGPAGCCPCAAALLAVLVASCWSPAVGAAAGMGAWVLVLAVWKLSQKPVTWLTGPGAQAAYAAVAVTLLWKWRRESRLHRARAGLTASAGAREPVLDGMA